MINHLHVLSDDADDLGLLLHTEALNRAKKIKQDMESKRQAEEAREIAKREEVMRIQQTMTRAKALSDMKKKRLEQLRGQSSVDSMSQGELSRKRKASLGRSNKEESHKRVSGDKVTADIEDGTATVKTALLHTGSTSKSYAEKPYLVRDWKFPASYQSTLRGEWILGRKRYKPENEQRRKLLLLRPPNVRGKRKRDVEKRIRKERERRRRRKRERKLRLLKLSGPNNRDTGATSSSFKLCCAGREWIRRRRIDKSTNFYGIAGSCISCSTSYAVPVPTPPNSPVSASAPSLANTTKDEVFQQLARLNELRKSTAPAPAPSPSPITNVVQMGTPSPIPQAPSAPTAPNEYQSGMGMSNSPIPMEPTGFPTTQPMISYPNEFPITTQSTGMPFGGMNGGMNAVNPFSAGGVMRNPTAFNPTMGPNFNAGMSLPPPVPPLPSTTSNHNSTNPTNIFAQMKSRTFANDNESSLPNRVNYDALRPQPTG
ncbi:hypothetical protein C8J55DRAFT_487267 [Lentinula edodes]|uniref:Uncharacterized protein n=1 Tax=Lentinula lateritia TaxID=40482 RepID=A0A9W9DVL9_9AGAR|nr:hypothetical protein C8J55DRAFT_487267 [Lentinula edodes]